VTNLLTNQEEDEHKEINEKEKERERETRSFSVLYEEFLLGMFLMV